MYFVVLYMFLLDRELRRKGEELEDTGGESDNGGVDEGGRIVVDGRSEESSRDVCNDSDVWVMDYQ